MGISSTRCGNRMNDNLVMVKPARIPVLVPSQTLSWLLVISWSMAFSWLLAIISTVVPSMTLMIHQNRHHRHNRHPSGLKLPLLLVSTPLVRSFGKPSHRSRENENGESTMIDKGEIPEVLDHATSGTQEGPTNQEGPPTICSTQSTRRSRCKSMELFTQAISLEEQEPTMSWCKSSCVLQRLAGLRVVFIERANDNRHGNWHVFGRFRRN